MTARAVLAELTAVLVVAAVTIDALPADLGRVARAAMAGRADQPVMPAGQREARRGIVIEIPRLPAHRVVAAHASGRRPQSALVVIVDMAIGAGQALGDKAFVGVAGDALRGGVLADQREAGQRMVEGNADLPVIAVMAGTALGS